MFIDYWVNNQNPSGYNMQGGVILTCPQVQGTCYVYQLFLKTFEIFK